MKLRFNSQLPMNTHNKHLILAINVVLIVLIFIGFTSTSYAHGVATSDQGFLQQNVGTAWGAYLYLGAKHMVTGYDHLLFLAGVIFFLYRFRDIAVYVSLFAAGHSITLLFGVLTGTHVNPYLIDAVIGLSVVYKAFENIGGFQHLPYKLDTRYAVFLFGLVHGFGLSTKLQDFALSPEGLIGNILAFNIGVELGQLLALSIILMVFNVWRYTDSFQRQAFNANIALMCAGFLLFGYQLVGYLTQ